MPFRLVSPYKPCGDQPAAIEALVSELNKGERHQVLLGITGSGKTFTAACVIEKVQRPTLVISHNKTLAAQLYGEFKDLFPESAVHYFVSYYDYYQPEAYVANSDTYIEKDAIVNDDIDRMRHAATFGLLARPDVIIVASVSCIFGIGSAEAYQQMLIELRRGQTIDRDQLLRQLVEIQYERNDYDFHRGTFRVRGDVVEIFPAHEEDRAIRIEFFGDEIESIGQVDPLRGRLLEPLDRAIIMPSSHYVTPPDQRRAAIKSISAELAEQLPLLRNQQRLLEAQRLEQRTMFDLEMMEQIGFCTGIENYSRHLSGRSPGQPPPTLIDYFPDDFLLIIDESHQTIPQIRAMYRGDRSRKETLVEHGFRMPSAMDNRPLTFEEFFERINQAIYVSATPGDYELELVGGVVVEQVIRPTSLLDPEIVLRPVTDQVDDLLEEIRSRALRNERVLVTTLTKRMAEDLTEYFQDLGVRVRYLHSDIETLERVEIIADLRRGVFDVLIGINLLREGLDLPEVSLVAILDADKEGFLRSTRSLIQTIGRASRNAAGKVIMYADRVTKSMKQAIDDTESRREQQIEYNRVHGLSPRTIQHRIRQIDIEGEKPEGTGTTETEIPLQEIPPLIVSLRKQMHEAAEALDFERAALLRDQMRELSHRELQLLDPLSAPPSTGSRRATRNKTKAYKGKKGRKRRT